jgi:hypothetical protein
MTRGRGDEYPQITQIPQIALATNEEPGTKNAERVTTDMNADDAGWEPGGQLVLEPGLAAGLT